MKALLYENEVANCWRAEIARADRISIAMALVTGPGLAEIRTVLQSHLKAEGVCDFLLGVDLCTQPQAIKELAALAGAYPSFCVRRFQPAAGQIFHPKFGVFYSKKKPTRAILGSTNMTRQAFQKNCEANLFVDDPRLAEEFAEYFDELWHGAYAKPITEDWLNDYQAVWEQREESESREREIRGKVAKIGSETITAGVPERVKGYRFAFTGAITNWPRKKLYPEVEKLKGTIAADAKGIPNADCLVHGNIQRKTKETQKLREARANDVPVITVEEFFAIVNKERALQRRQPIKL